MITVKVQCACGQRFAFDVEPVNNRMPSPIACPACGSDGTVAANAVIAQSLGAPPKLVPMVAPAIDVAPPPGAVASAGVAMNSPFVPIGTVRLDAPVGVAQTTATPVAAPIALPPIPPVAPPPVIQRAQASPRLQTSRPVVQKPVRGKDGWAGEETGYNKLGQYIAIGPAVLGAMLSWGMFGVDVPSLPICIAVGVCGAIGGAINVYGRGPVWAGMIFGPVTSVGAYLASILWLHGRQSVWKIELMIAFALGAAPGIGLQWVLQKLLRKRLAGS